MFKANFLQVLYIFDPSKQYEQTVQNGYSIMHATTYDNDIQWASRNCQRTCSCRISSRKVQRFMTYRASREKQRRSWKQYGMPWSSNNNTLMVTWCYAIIIVRSMACIGRERKTGNQVLLATRRRRLGRRLLASGRANRPSLQWPIKLACCCSDCEY